MKKVIYTSAVLVLVSTISLGQFPVELPIEIPSIRIQKEEKQNTETSGESPSKDSVENPVRSASTQSTNSVMQRRSGVTVLNDAATNFELETFTQNHKDIGWYPKPTFVMVGEVPKRSGFRYVIKKDGDEVYSHRCEVIGYPKRGNYEEKKWSNTACFDRKKYVAGTGMFDVEVYFIDGDTDKEELLRKLKIDVHRAAKFKDAPADYYAQRHADAAVGYISVYKPTGRLILHTFYTRDPELEKQFGLEFLRCTANGQSIEMSNPSLTGGYDVLARAIMSVRGNNPSGFKDTITFVRNNSALPLALNSNDSSFYNATKNPGKWECRIMGDGDSTVYRTFRFEISRDGTITPHPEQQKGNVNLEANETMIEIEVPAGGSTIDDRLLPQPEMGFFYGIPWTTEEGRAAARRLPRKGDPYPVP